MSVLSFYLQPFWGHLIWSGTVRHDFVDCKSFAMMIPWDANCLKEVEKVCASLSVRIRKSLHLL